MNDTYIHGDGDLYGLGVRLGIYSQIFASMLSKPESANTKYLSETLLIFQLAGFIGFIYKITATPLKNLYAAEGYLIYISWLYSSVSIMLGRQPEVGRSRKHLWPVLTLSAAMSGYLMWFLWVGMDRMRGNPSGADYAFILLKVDLFGWYRTFLKVIAVIWVLYCPYYLIYGDKFTPLLGLWLREYRSIIPFTCSILTILHLELTIRWNGIKDVNRIRGAGQLIPLLLGLGILLHISWLRLTEEQPVPSQLVEKEGD